MKCKFNKFTKKILNKLNNNYSNILNKNELEDDYDLDYTHNNKKYDKKYNINDINDINDINNNNKNHSDQLDIIYKELKSSKLYKNDQIYDIYTQNILGKGSFCKVYSGKLDGN